MGSAKLSGSGVLFHALSAGNFMGTMEQRGCSIFAPAIRAGCREMILAVQDPSVPVVGLSSLVNGHGVD